MLVDNFTKYMQKGPKNSFITETIKEDKVKASETKKKWIILQNKEGSHET